MGTIFSLSKIAIRLIPFIFQIVKDETYPESWNEVLGIDMLRNTTIDLANNTLQFNRTNFANFNQQEDRLSTLLNQISMDHLNHKDRIHLTNLCIKYQDVFYVKEYDNLKASNILEHEIPLTCN